MREISLVLVVALSGVLIVAVVVFGPSVAGAERVPRDRSVVEVISPASTIPRQP